MVCTDQLVSTQPGLVPQEKGSPTRAHLWGATIFVDNQTDYTKVHLIQDATGESTLEAKATFACDHLLTNINVGYVVLRALIAILKLVT